MQRACSYSSRERIGNTGDWKAAVKILLLEDDAMTSSFIEKGLRSAGHVVDACTTGRDAIFTPLMAPTMCLSSIAWCRASMDWRC